MLQLDQQDVDCLTELDILFETGLDVVVLQTRNCLPAS